MQKFVLVSEMGTSTGTLYFLQASQCINFIGNHGMKYTFKYADQPNKAAYMTVNSSCWSSGVISVGRKGEEDSRT